MPDTLKEIIAELQESLVETRRHLHQNPELGFEEHHTSALVADRLRALGLKPQTGIGKTGVVCLIEGRGAGKTLGLRADMDALPILEQTGLAYCSRTQGKMHACGHDGHTTILLGVAAVLARMRSEFTGRVKLIFQPSEESVSGAEAMIADGVLEDPQVNGAIALHGWPGLSLGKIGLKSGPLMASSDSYDITISGKGGHAAHPEGCVDPVFVAAHIVTALQGLVSRETSHAEPAVVTVTRLEAGTAYNVIPETARISGTFRTLSESKRAIMKRRVPEVAESIAKAFGAGSEFHLLPGCPVTSNDPAMVQVVEGAVIEALGQDAIEAERYASMGAEDFSSFTQRVPAMMFHLGLGERPFCHSPRFDFNDDAIPIGIEVFVRASLRFLG